MDPHLAAVDFVAVLRDAFLSFLVVAAIAGAFGFVYWIYLRGKWEREKAKRDAWLADRRAKRESGKKESAGR